MATVHDVARFVVDRFESDISTMKLQKLCFFAQGWNLALLERPLFKEDFQAWKNGPVCFELFDEHRGMYSVSSWPKGDADSLKKRERIVLEAMLRNYGALSGRQLSELTHVAGSPWDLARRRVGASPGQSSSELVTKDDIEHYFESNLKPT